MPHGSEVFCLRCMHLRVTAIYSDWDSILFNVQFAHDQPSTSIHYRILSDKFIQRLRKAHSFKVHIFAALNHDLNQPNRSVLALSLGLSGDGARD